jgi:membrane-associated protease RseP (regulator of RpoE activity)
MRTVAIAALILCAGMARSASAEEPSQVLVGLEVAPLKLKTPPTQKDGKPVKEGVLVTKVHKDSPAHKAGLTAGDVITTIDGKPIKSVEEWRTAWKAFGAKKPEATKCAVSGFALAKKKWRPAAVTVATIPWRPKIETPEEARARARQDEYIRARIAVTNPQGAALYQRTAPPMRKHPWSVTPSDDVDETKPPPGG